MTDNNTLFDEPKLDEFKTESPLRAFASFDMRGLYLIAKGFRPSLGHLTRYLDAMEKKEGWQFVQLLEAASGAPTIIFRNIGIPTLIDPHKEKLVRTLNRRLGLTGEVEEGEVAGVESVQFDGHPLEAPYGDFTLTIRGLDPESVAWSRVQWNGNPEEAIDRLKGESFGEVRRFLSAEGAEDLHHFWRAASVASMLRLIDKFEMWQTVSLGEYISDDALFTAIGWRSLAARLACNTDPYAAVAAAIRDTEVTSEALADDTNLDHPGPWTSRGSDIDIPAAFREECARFVLKNLVKPEHLEQSIREFKKAFLNPKGTPVSHTTMAQQLIFHLGSKRPHAVKRHIDQFRVMKGKIDGAREEPAPPAPPPARDVGDGFTSAKVVEHVTYQGGDRIVHEVTIAPAPKFDEANPEHYNGWECGDIGERLSANGYQILKYCWRLGKKDDPCKELGKALRYLERERDLMATKGHPNSRSANRRGIPGDTDQWVYARLHGQSEFTRKVALFLWDGYSTDTLDKLKAMIADHKATLDCGHGLAI